MALLSLSVPAHGVHKISGRSMSREDFLNDAVKAFKPPEGFSRSVSAPEGSRPFSPATEDVDSLMDAASSTRVVKTRGRDLPVRAHRFGVWCFGLGILGVG